MRDMCVSTISIFCVLSSVNTLSTIIPRKNLHRETCPQNIPQKGQEVNEQETEEMAESVQCISRYLNCISSKKTNSLVHV